MEEIKSKKYFSIKTKITLGIFLFSIVTLGIVFSVSYLNTKKVMMSDLDIRLRNMTSIAVLQINAEEHKSIRTPADMNTPSYKNINQILQNVKKSGTDIEAIYTFRENENNQITFVVDSEPDEYSQPGVIYDDANQFLIDNFMTIDSPIAEKEFTSDKWGTWISGYAPFYDSEGNREGVLGIDIMASDIVAEQNKIFYIYLVSFIISGFISILFGLYLSRKLTRSINLLTSILKNSGTINVNNISHISNDEVGDFTSVLKTTLDQISTTQKNTEDRVSDKAKMLEKMNKLMIGREVEMIKLKKENALLKKNAEGNNVK